MTSAPQGRGTILTEQHFILKNFLHGKRDPRLRKCSMAHKVRQWNALTFLDISEGGAKSGVEDQKKGQGF